MAVPPKSFKTGSNPFSWTPDLPTDWMPDWMWERIFKKNEEDEGFSKGLKESFLGGVTPAGITQGLYEIPRAVIDPGHMLSNMDRGVREELPNQLGDVVAGFAGETAEDKGQGLGSLLAAGADWLAPDLIESIGFGPDASASPTQQLQNAPQIMSAADDALQEDNQMQSRLWAAQAMMGENPFEGQAPKPVQGEANFTTSLGGPGTYPPLPGGPPSGQSGSLPPQSPTGGQPAGGPPQVGGAVPPQVVGAQAPLPPPVAPQQMPMGPQGNQMGPQPQGPLPPPSPAQMGMAQPPGGGPRAGGQPNVEIIDPSRSPDVFQSLAEEETGAGTAPRPGLGLEPLIQKRINSAFYANEERNDRRDNEAAQKKIDEANLAGYEALTDSEKQAVDQWRAELNQVRLDMQFNPTGWGHEGQDDRNQRIGAYEKKIRDLLGQGMARAGYDSFNHEKLGSGLETLPPDDGTRREEDVLGALATGARKEGISLLDDFDPQSNQTEQLTSQSPALTMGMGFTPFGGGGSGGDNPDLDKLLKEYYGRVTDVSDTDRAPLGPEIEGYLDKQWRDLFASGGENIGTRGTGTISNREGYLDAERSLFGESQAGNVRDAQSVSSRLASPAEAAVTSIGGAIGGGVPSTQADAERTETSEGFIPAGQRNLPTGQRPVGSAYNAILSQGAAVRGNMADNPGNITAVPQPELDQGLENPRIAGAPAAADTRSDKAFGQVQDRTMNFMSMLQDNNVLKMAGMDNLKPDLSGIRDVIANNSSIRSLVQEGRWNQALQDLRRQNPGLFPIKSYREAQATREAESVLPEPSNKPQGDSTKGWYKRSDQGVRGPRDPYFNKNKLVEAIERLTAGGFGEVKEGMNPKGEKRFKLGKSEGTEIAQGEPIFTKNQMDEAIAYMQKNKRLPPGMHPVLFGISAAEYKDPRSGMPWYKTPQGSAFFTKGPGKKTLARMEKAGIIFDLDKGIFTNNQGDYLNLRLAAQHLKHAQSNRQSKLQNLGAQEDKENVILPDPDNKVAGDYAAERLAGRADSAIQHTAGAARQFDKAAEGYSRAEKAIQDPKIRHSINPGDTFTMPKTGENMLQNVSYEESVEQAFTNAPSLDDFDDAPDTLDTDSDVPFFGDDATEGRVTSDLRKMLDSGIISWEDAMQGARAGEFRVGLGDRNLVNISDVVTDEERAAWSARADAEKPIETQEREISPEKIAARLANVDRPDSDSLRKYLWYQNPESRETLINLERTLKKIADGTAGKKEDRWLSWLHTTAKNAGTALAEESETLKANLEAAVAANDRDKVLEAARELNKNLIYRLAYADLTVVYPLAQHRAEGQQELESTRYRLDKPSDFNISGAERLNHLIPADVSNTLMSIFQMRNGFEMAKEAERRKQEGLLAEEDRRLLRTGDTGGQSASGATKWRERRGITEKGTSQQAQTEDARGDAFEARDIHKGGSLEETGGILGTLERFNIDPSELTPETDAVRAEWQGRHEQAADTETARRLRETGVTEAETLPYLHSSLTERNPALRQEAEQTAKSQQERAVRHGTRTARTGQARKRSLATSIDPVTGERTPVDVADPQRIKENERVDHALRSLGIVRGDLRGRGQSAMRAYMERQREQFPDDRSWEYWKDTGIVPDGVQLSEQDPRSVGAQQPPVNLQSRRTESTPASTPTRQPRQFTEAEQAIEKEAETLPDPKKLTVQQQLARDINLEALEYLGNMEGIDQAVTQDKKVLEELIINGHSLEKALKSRGLGHVWTSRRQSLVPVFAQKKTAELNTAANRTKTASRKK